MNEIRLTKRIIQNEFQGQVAHSSHFPQLLSGEFVLYVDGMLAGAQLDISWMDEFQVAAKWAHYIETEQSYRSSGMPTNSKTFGFMPRRPLGRGDWCAKGVMHEDQQAAADCLANLGRAICGPYVAKFEARFQQHVRNIIKIDPTYRMDGVFTSGIVNRDNRLPYHYDAGNVKNCWSGMVTFKRNCRGGNLAVPELGVTIENFDGSLLLFDGQSLLHGVTEFAVGEGGHRVTVVYYSLEQLWRCLEFPDEIIRGQLKRDEMENGFAIELALTAEHDDVLGPVREMVLQTLDKGKISSMLAHQYGIECKLNEEMFWNSVHRAITGIPTLPATLRSYSKAYLEDKQIANLEPKG